MNQAVSRATLFAPEEFTALFECAAGDLARTLDSLRYLGNLLPLPVESSTGR